MTLNTELARFKASWAERAGAEIASTIATDIDALRASGILERARSVGRPFPRLVLPDQLNRPVALGDLITDGPLIVTFYRGGWCPYCNLELRAFQALLADITAAGGQLVAVSPEMPDHGLTTAEKNDLAFPVLSDSHGLLAQALGISFELTETIRSLYQRFGHDLPSHNGDGRWSLPMPATYVVDRDGTIAFAAIDPDYRTRAEPAAALEALRALMPIAA
jgi:peroxiredoxin